MAVSKTESAMGLLNFSCKSRQSDSTRTNDAYVESMKQIIEIFGNAANARRYNEESIENFIEHVSCTKYLNNRELYPGIDSLTAYSRQVTQDLVMVNEEQMVR